MKNPFDSPRYVQMAELVPIVTGTIAIYAISPSLDWIDLQSPRPIRLRNAIGAGLAILAFGCLPALARFLWGLSPIYSLFIPSDLSISNPSLLAEVAPYASFLAVGAKVVFVLSFACLGVAFFGRVVGPLLCFVAFAILLIAQGHFGFCSGLRRGGWLKGARPSERWKFSHCPSGRPRRVRRY